VLSLDVPCGVIPIVKIHRTTHICPEGISGA
jgi:hypothetical protein